MGKPRTSSSTPKAPTGRRVPRRAEEEKPDAPRWWRAATNPLSIGILSVAAVFLVLWPFGNYAVDDEWAFLKSLQHLQVDGQLRILDWNPMSLIGMLYWGAIFTKVAGFSITVARVSAFASFALLAVSVALVLRQLHVDRTRTTMAVLAVVFNPLCLFHGVIYMTDVPGMVCATLAAFFMLIGLEDEAPRQRWMLVAGSAIAGFGMLIRQGLIVVPIALLLYLLLFRRRRLLSVDGILAAVVLPGAVAASFSWWYWHVHGATIVFQSQSRIMSDAIWHPIVSEFIGTAFKNAIYVGFFVLPLAAAGVWRSATRTGRGTAGRRDRVTGTERALQILKALAPPVLLIGCVAYILIQADNGVVFPYLGNKISPYGFLGPNELIVGDRPVLWGPIVAWLVAGAAVTGLLALTITFRRDTSEPGEPARPGLRFMVLLGLVQFLYTIATYKTAIDRHLLVLLPTFVILFAAWLPHARVSRLGFSLVLIPFAWYGLACTHDVHAFSRAAFEAGADLMARGVPAHDIDGGYAFDGWWCFEEGWRDRIVRSSDTDSWWVRSMASGVDSRYVLSLSATLEPRPDRDAWRPWSARPPILGPRDVVMTRNYSNWWPYGERTLYVLRRRGE